MAGNLKNVTMAQQQDAVPDWLNPLPLGIMSASAYMINVA